MSLFDISLTCTFVWLTNISRNWKYDYLEVLDTINHVGMPELKLQPTVLSYKCLFLLHILYNITIQYNTIPRRQDYFMHALSRCHLRFKVFQDYYTCITKRVSKATEQHCIMVSYSTLNFLAVLLCLIIIKKVWF